MTARPARRETADVPARADLVREARALGIDLTEVVDQALAAAVRARRRDAWVAENRVGFESYDRFVAAHGVFGDGKTLF